LKRFLLLVAILAFSAFALSVEASQVEYCLPSVEGIPVEQWASLGIEKTSLDPSTCVCFNGDVVGSTDWSNAYCKGHGVLVQSRVVQKRVKPACGSDSFFETEYRDVGADFCKKCPEAKVVGGWERVDCLNGVALWRQPVEAFVFSPSLDKCFKMRFSKFKLEGSCDGNAVSVSNGDELQEQEFNKVKWFSVIVGNLVLLAVALAIGLFVYYRVRK